MRDIQGGLRDLRSWVESRLLNLNLDLRNLEGRAALAINGVRSWALNSMGWVEMAGYIECHNIDG